MSKFPLRDYQQEIINRVRDSIKAGNKKIILQLPTGGGKSRIASEIIDLTVAKGGRALFTCHRQTLVHQIFTTIGKPSETSVSMGASGAFDKSLPIQIGMLQTLKARMNKFHKGYLGELNIIILDEVQYGATSAMQQELYMMYPDVITIGLSATPCDAQGYRLKGWDDVVSVVQSADLVDMGFLVNPKCLAPSKPDLSKIAMRAGDYATDELASIMDNVDLVTNVVENYEKYTNGKKALVFAVNIKHCEHIAESFALAGHSVGTLHSKQNKTLREATIKKFADDKIRVLVSVDALSVGFDEPSAEVAILARPTKSIPYYLQQVGRVLRLHESKQSATVLDLGNCISNCGHPLAKRDFTKPRPSRVERTAPKELKECDECSMLLDEDNKARTIEEDEHTITLRITCRNCGYDLNEIIQTKGAIEEDLEEVKNRELEKPVDYSKMVNRYDGFQELRKISHQAGYKTGWAWVTTQAITKHGLWREAQQIFSRVQSLGLAPNSAINELRAIIKQRGREW